MILLDTCAIVFDALSPDRLSQKARQAIEDGDVNNGLSCCTISLWEIAMLIAKGRIDPGTDAESFLKLILAARRIRPLAITPEIASLSANSPHFRHSDPADRIIMATALYHNMGIVTCDEQMQDIRGLVIVW